VAVPPAVDAYTSSAEGASLSFPVMLDDFIVQGVDPEYDPASPDPIIAGNSMSTEELESIAVWLAQFQP
jgi:hypothetical protein